MGFHRLRGHDRGHILLINLAEMSQAGLLPTPLHKPALRSIRDELAKLSGKPSGDEVVDAFGRAILKTAARMQVKGVESPPANTVIAGVMSFDKIRGLLEKIAQRFPTLVTQIDGIVASDAPDATVAKAADIINRVAPRASDLTLSEWGTIFWAAPAQEVDRMLAGCPPGAPPTAIARSIRDTLGLIHMDYNLKHPNRHLFLFRAQKALTEIDPIHKLTVSRPTTLDGYSNPRFCQAILPPAPFFNGCGMTVNVANWLVRPGAAELVCTPIPVHFFTCSYIGPVDKSEFGPDSDFVKMIVRSHDLDALVDYLLKEAA